MCARSNGQLVCVKRRPRSTEAPTVTAAKASAKKSRRPLGTDVMTRSSALRPATLMPCRRGSPKLRRQHPEARKPLLPQHSLLHRRLDGAARLRVVPAVAEAAIFGERRDIVERLLDAVLGLPEPDFTHSRVVDQ